MRGNTGMRQQAKRTIGMRCTVGIVEMPDANEGGKREQRHANDPDEETPMTTEAGLHLRPEHSAWFERGKTSALQFLDALKKRQRCNPNII